MQALKIRYLILVCILAAGVVIGQVFSVKNLPADGQAFDISRLPEKIGGWNGTAVPVDAQVTRILETDSVLLREYRNGSGGRVGLALVYYGDGERIALHLPESCLLGRGTRLISREDIAVRRADAVIPAVKLTTQSRYGRDIIIYYFQTAGCHTGSYLSFRRKALMNRFAGRQGGCSLVRFSSPIIRGEEQRSLEMLNEFIREASSAIDGFLD